MENRPLSVAALLIAASGFYGGVLAADEPDPAQVADWERRNRKAGELIEQARQMHQEAKRFYAEKSQACHQKFQVNACLSEAHREQSKQIADARRVENQGKALEREVRKEQQADHDARYLAGADQRAADLRKRQAEISSARRQAEDHEASTRASKEREAVEGARRQAANAERIAKKQDEHAARVARKKAEAAARLSAETTAH